MLPLGPSAFSVSAPLALLSADAIGIRVSVRPAWVASFARRMAAPVGTERPAAGAPLWEMTWEQVAAIRVARRSIALVAAAGRSCRFVTLRRQHLKTLLVLIEARGIAVEHVRSTFPDAMRL